MTLWDTSKQMFLKRAIFSGNVNHYKQGHAIHRSRMNENIVLERHHRFREYDFESFLFLKTIQKGPWCKRNVNTAMDQSQIQRVASSRRMRSHIAVKNQNAIILS